MVDGKWVCIPTMAGMRMDWWRNIVDYEIHRDFMADCDYDTSRANSMERNVQLLYDYRYDRLTEKFEWEAEDLSNTDVGRLMYDPDFDHIFEPKVLNTLFSPSRSFLCEIQTMMSRDWLCHTIETMQASIRLSLKTCKQWAVVGSDVRNLKSSLTNYEQLKFHQLAMFDINMPRDLWRQLCSRVRAMEAAFAKENSKWCHERHYWQDVICNRCRSHVTKSILQQRYMEPQFWADMYDYELIMA